MQRGQYTNPNGATAVFGLAPPFVFGKIKGVGTAEPEFISSTPALIDGETLHDVRIKPREIKLTAHIEGENRHDLYKQRQRLSAILNPHHNKDGKLGRLEYANDFVTVWIPAAIKHGPDTDSRFMEYHLDVELDFHCPDPYWRAITPSVQRISHMDGGFSFPVDLSSFKFGTVGFESNCHNEGDTSAPIIIEVAGPGVNPGIMNLATGEYIRVQQHLAAGDVLTIDTTRGNRRVTIKRTDGTVEDAFGYIDLSSTWLQLPPGDNVLQYIGGNGSRPAVISVTCFGRYGGV